MDELREEKVIAHLSTFQLFLYSECYVVHKLHPVGDA